MAAPNGGFLEVHQRCLHSGWLPWLVGAVLCLGSTLGHVTTPSWHLLGRRVGHAVWHVWSRHVEAVPKKHTLVLRLLPGAWFPMSVEHEPL